MGAQRPSLERQIVEHKAVDLCLCDLPDGGKKVLRVGANQFLFSIQNH